MASNHRGHGHRIAKGADISLMMAELMGRKADTAVALAYPCTSPT